MLTRPSHSQVSQILNMERAHVMGKLRDEITQADAHNQKGAAKACRKALDTLSKSALETALPSVWIERLQSAHALLHTFNMVRAELWGLSIKFADVS